MYTTFFIESQTNKPIRDKSRDIRGQVWSKMHHPLSSKFSGQAARSIFAQYAGDHPAETTFVGEKQQESCSEIIVTESQEM